MGERHELVEMTWVRDVFASGLANVESVGGGCFRFTLFAVQDMNGRHEHVVVAKIIMSKDALSDAMHTAAMQTGTCACQNARLAARN